jgi:hypothetical protein
VKARIAASVALAAALVLSTAGCSFFAAQATLKKYDPSDGVGTTIGDVSVRNALLLSSDGEEASLLINLINSGDDPISVKIQYTGTDGKVTSTYRLSGGEAETFGAKNSKKIVFQDIGKKPGTLLPVYVTTGDRTGKELLVPILDGTQAEYAGLLPAPLPTATPTNSPVPVPLPTAVTPSAAATPSN